MGENQSDAKKRMIVGLKPIIELIDKTGFLEKDELFLARNPRDGRMRGLISKAEKAKIPIRKLGFAAIGEKAGTKHHQGILLVRAEASPIRELKVEDLLRFSRRPKIFVALDKVQDTGNMGAIIRSMAAFGIDGLILASKHTAPLGTTVWKTSAGALARIPVCFVPGLAGFMQRHEESLYWLGADQAGVAPEKAIAALKGIQKNIVLVLGSEEKGISRLVRERLDSTIGIPITKHTESLNVSVAAGILLYELRKSLSV